MLHKRRTKQSCNLSCTNSAGQFRSQSNIVAGNRSGAIDGRPTREYNLSKRSDSCLKISSVILRIGRNRAQRMIRRHSLLCLVPPLQSAVFGNSFSLLKSSARVAARFYKKTGKFGTISLPLNIGSISWRLANWKHHLSFAANLCFKSQADV